MNADTFETVGLLYLYDDMNTGTRNKHLKSMKSHTD